MPELHPEIQEIHQQAYRDAVFAENADLTRENAELRMTIHNLDKMFSMHKEKTKRLVSALESVYEWIHISGNLECDISAQVEAARLDSVLDEWKSIRGNQ